MQNYSLNERFLIRTPRLPFDKYLSQMGKFENYNEQVAYLKEVFQNPIIQEALYIASSSLYEKMKAWQDGSELSSKKEKSLVFALMRYLIRMSSRCTPFGLFAGCSLGKWGKSNQIQLRKPTDIQRHTRPDMTFLCELAQQLSSHPEIQPHLLFFPNSSIYLIGGKLRYIEYFYKGKKRVHQITSVDHSIYLSKVLDVAKTGGKLQELAISLVDDEIDLEDAIAFVEELVASQVLISELDGNTTGEEMLDRLISKLEAINQSPVVLDNLRTLEHLKNALLSLDANQRAFSADDYIHIEELIKPLGIAFEKSQLLQLDYHRNFIENQLDKRFAGTIRRGIEALSRLAPQAQDNKIKQFAQRFSARYDTKEVPLNIALDVELGVGYSENDKHKVGFHPLIVNALAGIDQKQSNFNDPKISLDAVEKFLSHKLLDAHKNDLFEIELFDDELKKFPTNFQNIPDSIGVFGQVYQLDINQKHPQFFIESINGCAPNMLGRFTTLNPAIESWVKEITDKEQSLYPEEIILAEIVHLPESRTGNVLMRKVIRSYEIPYLAKSSVPVEFQLPLDDLMVSVVNNEVTLRSKRLNKRILPRMANAHNFGFNSLPIYEFLCDLQYQGIRRSIGFNWGGCSFLFKFFPRVKYHNLLLSTAFWNLSSDDCKVLLEAKDSELNECISTWRQKWKLPEKFLFVEGDNQLLIDTNNRIMFKTFLNEIKTKSRIVLREFLFNNTNHVLVQDIEGNNYTHELFIVFNRNERREIRLPMHSKDSAPLVKRSFLTGSEWLYYKIYCGNDSADAILAENLLPKLQELTDNQDIKSWFFIRYDDPDFHIRLRIKLTSDEKLSKVLLFMAPVLHSLQEEKLIWKIQIDGYDREIERYKNAYIEFCENIFWADSKTALNFLLLNVDEDTYMRRCAYGLLTLNTYLVAFQFTPKERLNFLEKLSNGFLSEFNTTLTALNTKLELLSTHKAVFQNFIFMPQNIENDDFEYVFKQVNLKLNSLYPAISKLVIETGNDKSILFDLCSSLIHMMVNRLFPTSQRGYELILYTFLYSLYQDYQEKQK